MAEEFIGAARDFRERGGIVFDKILPGRALEKKKSKGRQVLAPGILRQQLSYRGEAAGLLGFEPVRHDSSPDFRGADGRVGRSGDSRPHR